MCLNWSPSVTFNWNVNPSDLLLISFTVIWWSFFNTSSDDVGIPNFTLISCKSLLNKPLSTQWAKSKIRRGTHFKYGVGRRITCISFGTNSILHHFIVSGSLDELHNVQRAVCMSVWSDGKMLITVLAVLYYLANPIFIDVTLFRLCRSWGKLCC